MSTGEDRILNLLGRYFPNSRDKILLGRGDDCALIQVPFLNNKHAYGRSFAEKICAKNETTNKQEYYSETSHSPNSLGTNGLMAISSDIFTENAHFRTRYFNAGDIGHKSLAVNISDLAANGASPHSFVLNLTLTDGQDFAWLEEFFASMADLANSHALNLCGGDLAKAPTPRLKNFHEDCPCIIDKDSCGGLNIGVTVLGDYSHGGVPLMRHRSFCEREGSNSAQVGDILFMVGNIGLARLGFSLLENCHNEAEIEAVRKEYPQAVQAHLRPKALVAEGLELSHIAVDYPIFLMDISDGLMRDIPRLLSRQGILEEFNTRFSADIKLDTEALSPEIIRYCAEKEKDPCHYAYSGGEDYGLVGICSPEAWDIIQARFEQKESFAKIHALGKLTTVKENDSIKLNGKIVSEYGFDHF